MNETTKYHFITNEIDVYFNKDLTDKDKYIVCTCARNENPYLREFVQHYLDYNFDKVIICDNNNDNSVSELLSDYIEKGKVEVFDCHGFNSFQVQFYTMFAHEGNYKWCAYFDADEFLEIGCYNDIKVFLETINEDVVSFNWLLFGSNGKKHLTEEKIQERFPEPVYPIQTFKENMFIKSIVRGGNNIFDETMSFNGSHIPAQSNFTYNVGGYSTRNNTIHISLPLRYKVGYIKHYYTKSYDEWQIKSQRGWPDGTASLTSSRYFIFENNDIIKTQYLKQYDESLFGDSYNKEESFKRYSYLMDYDVINIKYPGNDMLYSPLINVVNIMRCSEGKTYILNDERFDDTFFNTLLEIAYMTNNRIVFARNDNEFYSAVEKYHKPEYAGWYYTIEFF